MDYSSFLNTLQAAAQHGYSSLKAYCQATSTLLPNFKPTPASNKRIEFRPRQVDFNNNVLLPTVLPFKQETLSQLQGRLVTIKTKGDGNCLFRAVSLLLCGNDSLHVELRLRTVIELCLNDRIYLGDRAPERREEIIERMKEEQQVTLTIDDRLLLSSFEQDVLAMAKENGWATIYGLEALSTVINKNILSICPNMMRSGLRNTYHKVIEPAMGLVSDGATGPPVCILWGKDGHIDISKLLHPNHFLPVVNSEILANSIKKGMLW